jgi:hypothetical protein
LIIGDNDGTGVSPTAAGTAALTGNANPTTATEATTASKARDMQDFSEIPNTSPIVTARRPPFNDLF